MKNEELYTRQKEMENNTCEAAKKKLEMSIAEKCNEGRENELSYGPAIISEMSAIVEDYIHNLRKRGRQNSKRFLFNEVFTRYNKHLQDIQDKVAKNERTPDAIKIVACSVALNLTRRLTSGDAVKTIAERSALDVCKQFGIPVSEWEDRKPDAMKFFTSCIREVAVLSGIFTIESSAHTGREHRVILNEAWAERVEKSRLFMVDSVAAYKPSLLVPIDHVDLVSTKGGYHFTTSPLLKKPPRLIVESVRQAVHQDVLNFNQTNFPGFFHFINKLQKTAYCVNTELLTVIESFREKCLNEDSQTYWFDFPFEENEALAAMTAKIEECTRNRTRAKNASKYKVEYTPLTKATVNQIHRNHKSAMKDRVRLTAETLSMAEEFRNDTFYFPVYVDYRSRIYPYVSLGLTTQGTELSKALLLLADKAELTEEGVSTLFETLANCIESIGDKLSCEKKEALAREWFEKHSHKFFARDFEMFFVDTLVDLKEIEEEFDNLNRKSKKTSKTSRIFSEPINALAIVIELVNHFTIDGYKSGYIAHRDARCSGGSIVSTALGCEEGMKLTSVIDYLSDEGKLFDMYSATANMARHICEERATADKIYADLLAYSDEHRGTSKDLFSRGIFKDPVMVGANYGGTVYGMRKRNETIADWNGYEAENEEEEVFDFEGEDEKDHNANEWVPDTRLTKEHKFVFDALMEEAIGAALPAQAAWLKASKKAAQEKANKDNHIAFTNPVTGFPVVYQTRVYESKKFIAAESGKRDIAITLKIPTNKVNKQKMVTSFSPNAIHSLDSALLYLVARQCEHDLAMIHDSIGSHPNNVKKTVEAYSKATKIYAENDLLNNIFESMGIETRVERIDTFKGELELSKHALV